MGTGQVRLGTHTLQPEQTTRKQGNGSSYSSETPSVETVFQVFDWGFGNAVSSVCWTAAILHGDIKCEDVYSRWPEGIKRRRNGTVRFLLLLHPRGVALKTHVAHRSTNRKRPWQGG